MSADLLRELLNDPILAARSIFPEWFSSKMPWVHRGIVALVLQRTDFLTNYGEERWAEGVAEWTREDVQEIIDNFTYALDPDDPNSRVIHLFEWDGGAVRLTTSRFLEVMMPRGVSKTTLFNFLICYLILFQLVKFVVYVSETSTAAEMQLGNVKRELESNPVILELFGSLQPSRSDPEKWGADFIETISGVAVASKGRGGQIRGLNVGGSRPDIIFLDDVEDKESVATDPQRRKTLAWFWGDVRPALPRHEASEGRIFVAGTMLHRESLMMNLARDNQFISVRFGAMLPDGRPLWPRYMTARTWKNERERYKRQGMLAEFYMEYQSSIHVDADSRKFKIENMKILERTRAEFELIAMACDPAISEKRGSDSFVIAVGGMTSKGFVHLLDMWSGVGVHPSQQVEEFFRLHFLWLPHRHGIEAIAYQAALIHLVREEQFRRSLVHGNSAYFPIIPITHGRKKVERIEGILAPRYAAGYITHQRRFAEIESEAIDWPAGKRDHLDAWAMTVGLLDPAASFAGPPPELLLKPEEWRRLSDNHASQCP